MVSWLCNLLPQPEGKLLEVQSCSPYFLGSPRFLGLGMQRHLPNTCGLMAAQVPVGFYPYEDNIIDKLSVPFEEAI